jgi:hypothetical protein
MLRILAGFLFIAIVIFSGFSRASENAVIYTLSVNPELTREFSKPLPELLIFDPNGKCVHYSAGFAGEQRQAINLDVAFGFAKVENSNVDLDKIEKDVRRQLADKYTDMSEEAREAMVQSSVDTFLNQFQPGKCKVSFVETLATLRGTKSIDWGAEKLNKGNFTIVKYEAEWCEPCHAQTKAIASYLDKKNVPVNWLKVERDVKKI